MIICPLFSIPFDAPAASPKFLFTTMLLLGQRPRLRDTNGWVELMGTWYSPGRHEPIRDAQRETRRYMSLFLSDLCALCGYLSTGHHALTPARLFPTLNTPRKRNPKAARTSRFPRAGYAIVSNAPLCSSGRRPDDHHEPSGCLQRAQ